MENKLKELSDILVNYSIHVEKGEKVLINSFSIKAKPLIVELVKSVTKAGAIPFVRIEDQEINRVLLENTTIDRMNEVNRQLEQDNENFDSYIRIRHTENEYESKYVDPQIKKDLGRITMNANEVRVNKRKWVLLNYPSLIDAYKASMPTEEFTRYALDAMTYDYKKMEKDLQPLKELMEKTDKVHIVGPNTDLTFSIKDIPVIAFSVGEEELAGMENVIFLMEKYIQHLLKIVLMVELHIILLVHIMVISLEILVCFLKMVKLLKLHVMEIMML